MGATDNVAAILICLEEKAAVRGRGLSVFVEFGRGRSSLSRVIKALPAFRLSSGSGQVRSGQVRSGHVGPVSYSYFHSMGD